MRALSALETVQIWEWGQPRHPVDRAVALLTLAQPELTAEQVAALSVGQRNARLLTLRAAMLGPKLAGYAECTQCGEKLEFTVEISTLRLPEPHQHEFELAVHGFDLYCRLPTSQDLASIVGMNEVEAARQLLLERCIVRATQQGQQAANTSLPDSLIAEVSNAVIEHDPQVEMRFEMECPACGHQWSTLFDVVTFFWTELGNRVRQLLYDVHILAQAYGWSEVDILGMSFTRRQLYLEWATSQR